MALWKRAKKSQVQKSQLLQWNNAVQNSWGTKRGYAGRQRDDSGSYLCVVLKWNVTIIHFPACTAHECCVQCWNIVNPMLSALWEGLFSLAASTFCLPKITYRFNTRSNYVRRLHRRCFCHFFHRYPAAFLPGDRKYSDAHECQWNALHI